MSAYLSSGVLVALFCLALAAIPFFLHKYPSTGPSTLRSYWKFAYGSFFKPHTGDGSGNQQDALESFYEYQADAYDATRTALLKGRDDMIRLVAAQLKHQRFGRKPVWVDIGGGTGWNIEQMGGHLDVANFFSAVYLVDLTPSLLKVAKARFDQLGWSNVRVVCMDCRYFDLADHQSPSAEDGKADLITMSYSLTMIPDFFPVLDMTTNLLNPDTGIFGVVDFYAQTEAEFMRRDYVGGFLDRHCTWLNRTFWRIWFEQDRVMFDGGRRDFLEYRFGTRLSINKRNAMLPGLRIPFYIWIGCDRHRPSTLLDTSVVRSSFIAAPEELRRPDVPLPSVFYQNHPVRTYYPGELHPSKSSKDGPDGWAAYNIKDLITAIPVEASDVILAPTGTGELVLALSSQAPAAIHAFDEDAAPNHHLELHLAAHRALRDSGSLQNFYHDTSGHNFRNTLLDKLSPHLSSQALQFWLNSGPKGWLSHNTPRPAPRQPSGMHAEHISHLSPALSPAALRIHTASLDDVLSRASAGAFTLIILPDGTNPDDSRDRAVLARLHDALRVGGRVLVPSAPGTRPWQIDALAARGYRAELLRSSIWLDADFKHSRLWVAVREG